MVCLEVVYSTILQFDHVKRSIYTSTRYILIGNCQFCTSYKWLANNIHTTRGEMLIKGQIYLRKLKNLIVKEWRRFSFGRIRYILLCLNVKSIYLDISQADSILTSLICLFPSFLYTKSEKGSGEQSQCHCGDNSMQIAINQLTLVIITQ